MTSSFWTVFGPNGNTIFSRVLDLLQVWHDKEYQRKLDSFITQYYACFGETSFEKTYRGNYPTSLSIFLSYFPHEMITKLSNLVSTSGGPLSDLFEKRVKHALSYFQAGGGKVRYIALGNYIIQSVLKPLHELIFAYLRSELSEVDYTFDQRKIRETYQR